jgi:hypothetical protein
MVPCGVIPVIVVGTGPATRKNRASWPEVDTRHPASEAPHNHPVNSLFIDSPEQDLLKVAPEWQEAAC